MPSGLLWVALLAQGDGVLLPADATPAERHAAEELRRFVREMTGGGLGGVEVVLNDRARIAAVDPEFAKVEPGPDGFAIRSTGRRLLVLGHRPRGTLYAVYSLLEDRFGVRFFTREVTRVPKRELALSGVEGRFELPELELRYAPPFEYRETFWTEAFDGDWAARRKSNGHHPRLEARHGGQVSYYPFVHTLGELVPPAKYFDAHPEYFSEVKGERLRERSQLCLTNPDVVRIAVEAVKGWAKAHPEATLLSVSQNDWKNPCQCGPCKAVDEREGSHSGSLLEFVNQVAEAVPDRLIDTLAYQYTRKPPRTARPRANVRVRLCSIECCFAHPIDSCERNRSFAEDLRGWAKLTDRLYVWDYTTSFSHYLVPFPNFDAIGPNVRFFAANGVVGVFEQGNYSPGGGGELSEIRAYVLSRLLWNPKVDVRKEVEDFTDGVYGEAGPVVREYLELLHEGVRGKDVHVRIGAKPSDPHLGADFLDRAEKLFARAEGAVKDEAIRKRLRKLRLPVDYVRLSRDRTAAGLQSFVAACREHGLTHVSESTSLEDFSGR